MTNIEEMLQLNGSDFKMILEGLEALKNKDFAGEMMGMMLEGILEKKPEDMTEEELQKSERRKMEKAAEKEVKEHQTEELKHQIDILKAKITLITEANRPIKESELIPRSNPK